MTTITARPIIPRIMAGWIKPGVLILTIAAGWWVLSAVDYKEYLSPTFLVAWLSEAGPLAPLALILMMATAVVIPPIPSLPLDLAAGATFGPFWGTVYAVIGAEIGALGCFVLARALGREALSRALKVEAVFCQMCTDHQLMGVMFLARLIPVFSFDLVSYGAGLTNISLKTFAVATLLGMTPPTFALTYLGSSIVRAQWLLVAAGVGMVALFLMTPRFLAAHREGRLATLLLGPTPAPHLNPEDPPVTRCTGCGAAVPPSSAS